jgi:hypothetical protein
MVFSGNSLTLDEGARLFVTSSSDQTLLFPGPDGNPCLILNGGFLEEGLQSGNSSTFTILGRMAVVAPSTIYHLWFAGGFVIRAQITGAGDLTVVNGTLSAPLDIQSANNPYSGAWQVQHGYLLGSGVGSLGTGSITVFNGATLEVDYDIQTPGALTLAGSSSVMVLHQDCQFGAVTIDGVALTPGTYTYNNLLAQFPGNFAPGGSGSITVPVVSSASGSLPPPLPPSPPPPPPSALAGFFVDYAGGSDSNVGTNPASAWQHCPGDPAATGVAAGTALNPGDTVWFKAGTTYTLAGDGNPLYQTGIGLDWSGSSAAPITYACSADWSNGSNTNRVIFTDGYTSKYIAAFYAPGAVANIVISNLEIGPIGGSATLPPDPGTGVPSRNGYGVFCGGTFQNITVANCYFHNLGYAFNTIPMDGNSLGQSDGRLSSAGIELYGSGSGVTITKCAFTHMHTAIDLAWQADTSDITITASRFYDFIVWGVDLAGIAGNLDYLTISGNNFSGMGWAYSPPNWTGYNTIPATCSTCWAGSPHQDPIFFRTSDLSVTCGLHNNIYGNEFHTTHPNEVFTADMYLEYAPSVNIYNNLFDNANAGVSTTGQNIYINSTGIITTNSWSGGGAPPVLISYELNQGGTIRILNNTMIVNLPGSAQSAALLWGVCGGCDNASGGNLLPYVWPANAFLQVENNLGYSWTTTGQQGTLLVLGVVTNAYPVPQWTVDYNDWHDAANGPYFWWNNQPGFNLTGGLPVEQSVGFDTHGITGDPLFASLAFGSSTNSANNNYQLQSGSPAIGAGVNLSGLDLPGLNADIAGNPRPASGPWAIGAYQQ